MKERLINMIEHYSLTSAGFADKIGVQRSSISHIISGRNKPSYDFIVKILENFTEINIEWLLTGKGRMLKSYAALKKEESSHDLFSQNLIKEDLQHNIPVKEEVRDEDRTEYKSETTNSIDEKGIINKGFTNVNSVKNVIFIYEDNTFEVINKKKAL